MNEFGVSAKITADTQGLKQGVAEAKSQIADLKEKVVDHASQMTGASRGFIDALLKIPVPLLAVGAAAAVLGKAAHDGSAEVKAMTLAIAQGGAISGQTAASMRALADDMASTSQLTIAESKAIGQAMASSGQIGAAAFRHVGEIAGDFARVMGTDIKSIGPTLVKLFGDPAKGAEELNKRLHFLSAAELDRIEHLVRTGEVTQAQIVLSDKLGATLAEIAPKLGIIESAWAGVKGVASQAWDAMMNVGRETTVKAKLDAVLAQIKDAEGSPIMRGMLPQLMQRAAKLQDQMDAESQRSADKASAAEQNAREQTARQRINRETQAGQLRAIDDDITFFKTMIGKVDGAADEVKVLQEKRAKLLAAKDSKGSGKSDLERMVERGQKNLMAAFLETGGEETMREVGEKRALASAKAAAHEAEALEKLRQKYADLETAQRVARAQSQSWEYGTSTALKDYLSDVQNVAKQGASFVTRMTGAVEDSFVKMATGGKIQIKDLFQTFAAESARAFYRKEYAPTVASGIGALSGWLGNKLGLGVGDTSGTPSGALDFFLPQARGGVFSSADLHNYANTIVSSPTLFKFAQGGAFQRGLMGEAGPEAIMPLTRGSNGKLGVQSTGGGVQVIVNDQRTAPSASPVSVEQGSSADGMQQIRILIRDEVRGQIGSGQLDASMRASYGVARTLTKRG